MKTDMKVTLMAHSQLSDKFKEILADGAEELALKVEEGVITDGQISTLTAIRTCYSANLPTEIAIKEGEKYFGKAATDGEGGTDADRLFRHITRSGHTSTLEHVSFTFAIEGVSRALLAQLTRHRVGFSFSVQSQRYVRLGSKDRSGGMKYLLPESVKTEEQRAAFESAMAQSQLYYDRLRQLGIPPEDARAVLPNATATNLVMTSNLAALLSFYAKRRKGNGAQHEIAELAEAIRREVVAVEPWTDAYFEAATVPKGAH